MNSVVKKLILIDITLNIGVWIRNMSILLYVMDVTRNNPFFVSLISIIQFSPLFLFSFIGGAFSDKWSPKNTMNYSFVLSGLSILLIICLIKIGLWQSVFIVTFVSVLFSQFSYPSSMKIIKMELEDENVQSTMALLQILRSMYTIFGPVIGTFLYETLGIEYSLLLNSLTFFISIIILFFIKDKNCYNNIQVQENQNLLSQIKQGLYYIKENFMLRNLFIFYLLFGGAIGLIQPLPVFVMIENLSLPKEFVKWFLMANGIGSVIGGVILYILKNRLSPLNLMSIGIIICSSMLLLIGFSKGALLTFVAQFIYGLFIPTVQTSLNTLVYKNTESSYFGRINGVFLPTFTGMMILMISFSGILKKYLNISVLYSISALIFILALIFIIDIRKSSSISPGSCRAVNEDEN